MTWKEILTAVNDALDFDFLTLAGTTIDLKTVLIFLLILAVTWRISRLSQRALVRFFERRGVSDPGTTAAAGRLLHYAVVLIGLGIGLETLGFNLGALFAAGAVFAVALGFAMQNIVQNFVSGIILLVERTIKPGDVLEIDTRLVRVVAMGIRTTVVRTRDDEDMIVPNSILVQSTVKNYTLRDSVYRLRVPVGVTYSSDLRLVRETLARTAGALPWRDPDHEPLVLLTGFGSSSVDYEVSVWIDDPWRSQRRLSDLHEAIWWALKEQGVVIAFPQVDVHFDPPVVDSVRALAAVG